MAIVLFAWAIWGAIVDHQYQRRGGTKPSRKDMVLFSVAAALCIAVLVFVAVTAGSGALGTTTALCAGLLFFLWEVGRWRVRRRFPCGSTQADAGPQKGIVYTDSEIQEFRRRGLM